MTWRLIGRKNLPRSAPVQSVTSGASGGTRLPANVVAHDSSAGQDSILIDQGSGKGVKKGMVVLSSQGSLIGTVTTVFGDQSFVRLITDSRSHVNAEVVESASINGTVQGSISRSLTFGLAQGDIKVGNTVMTSGLGGSYPPSIPIARVTEADQTLVYFLGCKGFGRYIGRLNTVRNVLHSINET